MTCVCVCVCVFVFSFFFFLFPFSIFFLPSRALTLYPGGRRIAGLLPPSPYTLFVRDAASYADLQFKHFSLYIFQYLSVYIYFSYFQFIYYKTPNPPILPSG